MHVLDAAGKHDVGVRGGPNCHTAGLELRWPGPSAWSSSIAAEDIGRMPAETSTARGRCLIDALIVWITPDRPLGPGLNRFQVRVSDDGGTWIERYGD